VRQLAALGATISYLVCRSMGHERRLEEVCTSFSGLSASKVSLPSFFDKAKGILLTITKALQQSNTAG